MKLALPISLSIFDVMTYANSAYLTEAGGGLVGVT